MWTNLNFRSDMYCSESWFGWCELLLFYYIKCAPDQSLKPCTIYPNELVIWCGGKTDINLKTMFHNLSNQLSDNEKHFKKFYLNNTYIKVLEENTFSDIIFDTILIEGCDNLTDIERYAFNGTYFVTKNFTLSDNLGLKLDETIYDTMSSFVNIGFIYLIILDSMKFPQKHSDQ